MIMKKIYSQPQVQFIRVNTQDVIVTSLGDDSSGLLYDRVITDDEL